MDLKNVTLMTLVSSILHIEKVIEGSFLFPTKLQKKKKDNPGNSGTFHSTNNQSKKF